jgi:murein DD-endopeptidase MepM/ murein hydrolase activator NlpD
MGVMRVIAIGAAALLVWTAAASRVSSQQRLPLASIVPGAVVTLPFGCTPLVLEPVDLLCPGFHIHTGVDLAAPTGTPVRAAAPGTTVVGFDPARAGIYVMVIVDKHVRLIYCHLSRVMVPTGKPVAPGDIIGAVGATGLATGPHLHFEVQVDRRAIDPVMWLAS